MILTNNQLSHVMSLRKYEWMSRVQRLTGNSAIVLQCVEDHEPKSVLFTQSARATLARAWPLTGDIWECVVILEHISYLRKRISLGKPYPSPKRPHLPLSQWGSYMKGEDANLFRRTSTYVLLKTIYPSGCFDQSLPCRIMLYEGGNTVINVWSDQINKFYRF